MKRLLASILTIFAVAFGHSALSFPKDKTDIIGAKFCMNRSDRTIQISVSEARAFISALPLYGDFPELSGKPTRTNKTAHPCLIWPDYYQLVLEMKDGKQKGVSFTYDASLIGYWQYSPRSVPESLRPKILAQLETWRIQWVGSAPDAKLVQTEGGQSQSGQPRVETDSTQTQTVRKKVSPKYSRNESTKEK